MQVVRSTDAGLIVQGDSAEFLDTLADESVDFCYIDPPFMSQKKRVGSQGSYDDTFTSTKEYIDFLAWRLSQVSRKLKPTGSIMVHVDPRVSHLVRTALDILFGPDQFINEIVWCYNSGGAGKRTLAKKHDTILFYGRTKDYKFNVVREPYPHDYGDKPGFHPDGRMLNDWWQISFLSTRSNERCGYPTQKPLELMRRILDITCDPGDVVLDFFCGSGTTGVAAKEKGCRYILCDENPEAVDHAIARLGLDDA